MLRKDKGARIEKQLIGALILLGAVAVSPGASASAESQPRSLSGSVKNGLIAYSFDGDIYVGDPATGETTAMVTNPEYEVNPIFGPGGRRIAFIRGNPQTAKAKVVVVRTDGSQERLIFPKGRAHRGLGNYGWTPNGDALVVQLDSRPFFYPARLDGELSLFDSLGRGKESVLTPPLPRTIGGHYWGNNQVAPMFRPPSGDRILSGDRVFSRDLKSATRIDKALKPYEPYQLRWPTWSPDGTQILFELRLCAGRCNQERWRLFVMSADGTRPRRVGVGDGTGGQWSPDGSQIAFERVREKTDRAVIVVLDLESGKERALESTSAAGKDAGARFPTITYNNVVHHWFYEGWTWAPDGRSLLTLENHRTRPWVVDIKTDTVTKLPWKADSMPSWQRVRVG